MSAAMMRNRFNRPLTADQVIAMLDALRKGALAQESAGHHGLADLLHKARHVMRILWREVALHDNLTENAATALATVERALEECIRRRVVDEAAHAIAELRRLQKALHTPSDTFATWNESEA